MNTAIDIVDDNMEQAREFAQLLGNNFGQTRIHLSATEWMRSYSATKPLVLVVDYFFPGERLSGEDILEWIIDNKHPVIPLVMSGDVDVERCRDWMRKGAHYVIPKPITRSIFVKLAPALIQAGEIAQERFTEFQLDLALSARLATCTQREREIVFRRLQGQSPQQLAEHYRCSYRTVVQHYSNAMRNLSGKEEMDADGALEHIHDRLRLYRLLREEFDELSLRGMTR